MQHHARAYWHAMTMTRWQVSTCTPAQLGTRKPSGRRALIHRGFSLPATRSALPGNARLPGPWPLQRRRERAAGNRHSCQQGTLQDGPGRRSC